MVPVLDLQTPNQYIDYSAGGGKIAVGSHAWLVVKQAVPAGSVSPDPAKIENFRSVRVKKFTKNMAEAADQIVISRSTP
jgi:hypothetical protein